MIRCVLKMHYEALEAPSHEVSKMRLMVHLTVSYIMSYNAVHLSISAALSFYTTGEKGNAVIDCYLQYR